MQADAQPLKQAAGRLAVWLAVAGVYLALGLVGLHWATLQENTSVIWPATGMAIAVVFRLGYGVWPGLFLGAAGVVLTTSAPWAAALTIGLGNTLEAVLGVWLFRRFAGSGEPLETLGKTFWFMAVTVLVGPLCSVGLGSLALAAFIGVPEALLPGMSLTWWMGNVAGGLVVAPVLLAWTARPWPGKGDSPVEWLGLLVLNLAIAWLAFGLGGVLPASNYPLAYLPFPAVVWAALRYEQRGGSLALLLVAMVAVLATGQGLGPFARAEYLETYWLLLVYIIVGAATMLMVTAVIHERVSQRRQLAQARDELERRVDERTRELHATNQALAESEGRLRLVVSEAPVILWSLDAQGRFTFAQGRGLEALGVDAEDMVGRAAQSVFAGNAGIARSCERLLAGETVKEAVAVGNRVFEQHAVPLRAVDGQVSGAIGVCMDVTERALAEEKLRLDATVFANTTEGVMITDAAGTILAVNPAFSEITGYAEAEVLGANPRLLRSDRHDQVFYQGIWQAIAEQGRWQGEIWNRRKNGEVYPEWLSISAVPGELGAASHYVAVFSDISSIKISQRQLDFLAYHDPLTGLANRLLFHERLAHAIQRAERERERLAVLFVDLDHFKHVNDSLGHPVGDALLVEWARRLTEVMRGEDTVARLGGDEFVVLVEGVNDPEDVVVVAEKLLEAGRLSFRLAGREIYVGSSIGISIYPEDGSDAEHLIKNADAALYLAKGQGRDTLCFYTADLTRRALERVETETELRRALANGEFVLHYQPQICLNTGNVLAVETLLRWQHPGKGLLAPAAFLRVAEESSLIVPIGAWVLETACRQMAAWLEAGYALEHIAVNVSGIQVERDGLQEALDAALQASGLSPYFLELEITEGALALERAEVMLAALKTRGLRISVDDFGTGFSSMSYLKRLPLDGLKIDRSFVMGCERDPEDSAIVESILTLGRGLNLSVVAEGVETAEEMAWLKRLGCDTAQGYHFARPLPADEVARFLALNR